MRRPRIEDYDPNLKLPELASPIDGMPVIGKPPQKVNGVSPIPVPEKQVTLKEKVKQIKHNGTPDLAPKANTNKRPVKPRHGFDIYWDQHETLLQWSNYEKLKGATGSMSRMMREALDDYIAKRKNQ